MPPYVPIYGCQTSADPLRGEHMTGRIATKRGGGGFRPHDRPSAYLSCRPELAGVVYPAQRCMMTITVATRIVSGTCQAVVLGLAASSTYMNGGDLVPDSAADAAKQSGLISGCEADATDLGRPKRWPCPHRTPRCRRSASTTREVISVSGPHHGWLTSPRASDYLPGARPAPTCTAPHEPAAGRSALAPELSRT